MAFQLPYNSVFAGNFTKNQYLNRHKYADSPLEILKISKFVTDIPKREVWLRECTRIYVCVCHVNLKLNFSEVHVKMNFTLNDALRIKFS